jgi:hypothetical protein
MSYIKFLISFDFVLFFIHIKEKKKKKRFRIFFCVFLGGVCMCYAL